MGLPSIIIKFKTTGISAIKRGSKGIVALIIKDANLSGPLMLTEITGIPENLNADNKSYIERAFIGGMSVPKKVIVYGLEVDETVYTEALNYFATCKFDYLVGAPDITTELATTISTWVKSQRENFGKRIKAVLPNVVADHEGIINFTTSDIKVGEKTFTAAQYCSRIAGIFAGTPLNMAATFTVLSEIEDVPRLDNTQADAKIDAGELILYHDGEKVKIGRAVNSFTTVTTEKGESFKKIKLVDIMDLTYDDIKTTANDNYIGKISNTYDNKCLLITAIKGYFEQLELNGLYEIGMTTVEINLEKQRAYLKSTGVDVDSMSEYEIKSANTGAKVFLRTKARPIDAMEDIEYDIEI